MKNPWLIGVLAGLAFWGVAAVVSAIAGVWHPGARYSLTDPNPAVRAAAVRELKRDGNEQLLIDRLRDEDPDVRLLAAQRLGREDASGAVLAALITALKDEHAGVRREAAWSLGKSGPNAWPHLRDALRDEDPRGRAGAALALSNAYRHKEPHPWPSQESKTLVPILNELVNDADPEVRRNAEAALHDVSR
jgi:HEAT repeat protein